MFPDYEEGLQKLLWTMDTGQSASYKETPMLLEKIIELASVNEKKGEYSKSLKLLLSALTILRKSGDSSRKAVILNKT